MRGEFDLKLYMKHNVFECCSYIVSAGVSQGYRGSSRLLFQGPTPLAQFMQGTDPLIPNAALMPPAILHSPFNKELISCRLLV